MMFAERGRLEYTADGLVLCHMCGEAFRNLSLHVRQAHGIRPAEYRERFGLNRTTGLIGIATRAVQANNARRLRNLGERIGAGVDPDAALRGARQGRRDQWHVARDKTDCLRGHPLSGTNVRITRQGRRACKACHALWERDRRQRRKAA